MFYYILKGYQFDFLQSSACLGAVPAGGDLLETGSVFATEKYMTTIWDRYTKYREMPARRMSWTMANNHIFKTQLRFIWISLNPGLPLVSWIHFLPLTPTLCFLAHCSSSLSNNLMVCFIEGPFLGSAAIRKLVWVDAFMLNHQSAPAKLCSPLESCTWLPRKAGAYSDLCFPSIHFTIFSQHYL